MQRLRFSFGGIGGGWAHRRPPSIGASGGEYLDGTGDSRGAGQPVVGGEQRPAEVLGDPDLGVDAAAVVGDVEAGRSER